MDLPRNLGQSVLPGYPGWMGRWVVHPRNGRGGRGTRELGARVTCRSERENSEPRDIRTREFGTRDSGMRGSADCGCRRSWESEDSIADEREW